VRQEIGKDRNGGRSVGHKIKPQSGEEVNTEKPEIGDSFKP
jgi:hypothetical protein